MKHNIIAALFLASVQLLPAQSEGLVNYSTYGAFQEIYAVENNNFLSIGTDASVTNRQEIIKWNQNLYPVWSVGFPPTVTCRITKVVVLNDGNYAALFCSPANGTSALIMKLDTAGTILWQKEYYFSAGSNTAFSIAPAFGSDNGFIFGGGACAESNFLVKCDANGNIEWQKSYNDYTATGAKTAWAILPDATGYYVASDQLSGGKSDVAIMRIDLTGTLQWFKQLKRDGNAERPFAMYKLANGKLVVHCWDGLSNATDILYYMDSTCTTVTANTYVGGTDPMIAYVTPAGGSDLIGVGVEYYGTFNSRRIYLRLDGSGNILWQKMSKGTGSSNQGAFYGVAPTGTGNFVAAGGASSSGVGRQLAVFDGSDGSGLCVDEAGPFTMVPVSDFTVVNKSVTPFNISLNTTVPAYDPYATTLTRTIVCGTITGMTPGSIDENTVSVYPNPAQTLLNIETNGTANIGLVQVMDLQGRLILSANNPSALEVAGLPAGTYFIHYETDAGSGHLRFVKE